MFGRLKTYSGIDVILRSFDMPSGHANWLETASRLQDRVIEPCKALKDEKLYDTE